MKQQIVFSFLVLVLMVSLFGVFVTGCDEGMNIAGDVVGPTNKPTTPTMGEVKKPDPKDPIDPKEPTPDQTPAEVVELGYYADEDFTEPLIDRVWERATIYTKIVFSKAVPVVIADDTSAQPKVFHSAEVVNRKPSAQYRIKPRDAVLRDGDAKLYRDTDNILICRNQAPWNKLGRSAVFYIRVNNQVFRDTALLVIIRPTSSFFSGEEYPAPEGDHGDFIGQVRGSIGGRSIESTQPVVGATVTVVKGPMAGERVITNRGGYYHFREVTGDELHLLVEKEHFEPKEVIVHRSRPTTLTNQALPIYPSDAQHTPGIILIGRRWPDEVRFILDEVFLVPDLLLVMNSFDERTDSSGTYSPNGTIKIWGDGIRTGTHAHELAHAHQHALELFYGGDAPGNFQKVRWKDTPEGKAYTIARDKDLREVGELDTDSIPGYDGNVLFENAANVCADYWTVDPFFTALDGDYHKGLQVKAPNRYKWCKEWLNKKYD